MAKRKPPESSVMGNPITPKPKAVSKAKAPKGKTPLDSMIEAGDKLATADPFVPNEFGVIPPQTGETGLTIKGVPLVFVPGESETMQDAISKAVSSANPKEDNNEKTDEKTDEKSTQDANESPQPAATEPVSLANNETKKNNKTETQGTQSTQEASESPQSTGQDSEKNTGNVAIPVAESAEDCQNEVLAREETRAQASNRWVLEGRRWEADTFRKDVIRQCRAKGMTKDESSDHAWKACLAQFPPPGIKPAAISEPIPEPPKPVPEAIAAPVQTDGSVSGLSNFPPDWPKLPANAQLQQEIAWVTANRLLVRDGTGVNLSRAMSPPPSYSALSWLETSILFPAKFADISVKATAETDDEREFIKREKFAIEEIRGILKEMLDAKG